MRHAGQCIIAFCSLSRLSEFCSRSCVDSVLLSLLSLSLSVGVVRRMRGADERTSHHTVAQASVDPQPIRLPIIDGTGIRFTRLSTADGPSQTVVGVIVQDDQGFMWFGAPYGLTRYDGYTFKLFVHDPRNPNSLSGTYVYSLFKDHNGSLWVGCDQFLNRFDPATETFKQYPVPFATHISQDHAGTLWLATRTGLYGLDPTTGRIHHYSHDPKDPSSLSSSEVKSSGEDKEGRFWVANTEGLDEFDRRTGKVALRIRLYESSNGLSFYEDRFGVFWIYHVSGNALAVFDRKANTLKQFSFHQLGPPNTALTGVTTMLEDRNGTLWLATHGAGLLRFDRDHKRFIRYRNNPGDPESLPQNNVESLFVDREGSIWAGLGRLGLVHFGASPPTFQRFTHLDSAESTVQPFVGAIYEDRQGILWIGTPAALNRIDRKTGRYTYYRRTAGPAAGTDVITIREDHSGNLWAGTYGHGLLRFDRGTGQFKAYRHNPADPYSLSDDFVSSLLVDHNGTLWAASSEALNRFDPATERFSVYKLDPQRKPFYLELVEDREGALWLGTDSSGLQRFNPVTGQVALYQHDTNRVGTLSDNRVNSVYFDRSGTMWVGTQNGLNRLDPKASTFTIYSQQDGLPGNAVGCILEDNRGDLWMSTNNGVSRFNPPTRTFGNYSITNGLPGPDLTGWGAGFKSPSGEMFFGGFSGATAFFPDVVEGTSYTPPVVLTDFLLLGNRVAIGGHSPLQNSISYARDVILSHDHNLFSLTFAVLSYVNPATNRYRYKLEGLERRWNAVGSDHRQVTYTTLPAGMYTFRAQGATSSGAWTEPGVALRIRILPPWWGTSWFRSASATFILISIWLLYRLRIRNLEERERHFRKLAENAPDIVMRFDPDLRYSYVNPIVEEYTGLRPTELLGRTNQELNISAKYVQSWEAGLRQVFNARQATMNEFTFNTPKGERHFESRLVPEVGAGGSVKSVLAITRDVTERKRASEALLRSEAYLAEAQKLSHTGSFGWDVSSGEIYWSRETFRIFEYEPTAKVTIELILQRTHPEDRAAVQQLIDRVSRERTEFDFEHRLLMPDGSVKYLRVVGRPSKDEWGHFEFVGAVTDITEVKRSEEDRKQAEDGLRAAISDRARVSAVRADISMALARKDDLSGILHACAEALVQHLDAAFARIWTLNSDGQELELQASAGMYTRLNGRYSRIPLGQLKIGLIAQEGKAHLSNDVENDPRIDDKEWARTEKIISFAGYPLVVDDRVVGAIGMFSRSPLTHSTIDTLALVAGNIAQGIERKRAEEALRESEEQTRLIVDTAPDAAVTIDANGDVRRWNAAAERMFGWTAGEAINRRVSELIIPPLYHEAYQHGLQKFLTTGKGAFLGKTIEATAVRRDGQEFPVELSVAPAKLGGAWVFNAFVRDVTERKRAEAALQEAQAELTHVTRLNTMGEFAASIAHEVNQPLTAIVANGNACLRWLNADPVDLDEARESIERIIQDGNRSAEVIKTIRGMAKKSALQLAPLSMNELIAEALALTRGEIQRNRALLKTDLSENLPLVLGDRVQLEQVLLNLILNGMEAMSEVASGQRSLVVGSGMRDPDRVVVYVRDCGAGIRAEVMQNIFKPFFTTKPGGTGMGLSISRSIVQAHRGGLWATPNEDRGMTFSFSIPAARQ